MFKIGNIFECGKSNIPKGCLYALDIDGAIKLEANCRNAAMIAVAIVILAQLDDDDFQDFVKGWNHFTGDKDSTRCFCLEEAEALRKENIALRTENANLRFALSKIGKEEK